MVDRVALGQSLDPNIDDIGAPLEQPHLDEIVDHPVREPLGGVPPTVALHAGDLATVARSARRSGLCREEARDADAVEDQVGRTVR